jgi:hypothetical protein
VYTNCRVIYEYGGWYLCCDRGRDHEDRNLDEGLFTTDREATEDALNEAIRWLGENAPPRDEIEV